MKLSVAMITYNHEKYIAQALDSVLMQEVNFDYEIVIGDDLSQDRTREILLGYQEKYPDKIRLLLHEKNLGPGGNIYHVLNSCQGEYIALLEGDDYWTSPNKLQIQAKFLDQNRDCALAFYAVNTYYEETGSVTSAEPKGPQCWTLLDLLARNFFPRTCSVMYRARMFEFPSWFTEVLNGDLVLFALCGQYGNLCEVNNEPTAVYRVHKHGVWSGADYLTRLSANVKTKQFLNSHFGFRYEDYFRITSDYLELARTARRLGDKATAKLFLSTALSYQHGGHVSTFEISKTKFIVRSYEIYKALSCVRDVFQTVRNAII